VYSKGIEAWAAYDCQAAGHNEEEFSIMIIGGTSYDIIDIFLLVIVFAVSFIVGFFSNLAPFVGLGLN
jgi:hypothetical protein